MKYDLVIFDIDGTLCLSGKTLSEEELQLIDTANPAEFKNANLAAKIKYTCFPGVINTLEQLKLNSVKLGIASNGPSFRQKNKLIAAGIDNLFEKELVIISEDLALFYHNLDTGLNYWPTEYAREEYLKRVEKPNPNMLSHILIRANAQKQSTIYVGNAVEDFTAAQKAGLAFIRVIDKEKKGFKAEKEIHQNEFHKLIDLLK